MVKPTYPPEGRSRHIEGDVVLRLQIAKDGAVNRIQTASGDPILAAAAEKAVTQWRYQPYRLNGKMVEFETEVTVRFRLTTGGKRMLRSQPPGA